MKLLRSPRLRFETDSLCRSGAVLVLLALGAGSIPAAETPSVGRVFGISSWHLLSPGQVSRAQCPELRSVPLIIKWSQLEPKSGQYAFAKKIGKRLHSAVQTVRPIRMAVIPLLRTIRQPMPSPITNSPLPSNP